MVKKSKQERKEKHQAWANAVSLKNASVASLPNNNSPIPSGVTRINADLDSAFSEPYKLIFEYYNHDVCDLYSVTNKATTKQIINTLNKITKYGPSKKMDLIRDSVKRDGQYKQLYKDLEEEDIVIEEVDFNDHGRIYCHFVNSFCSVIAIREHHLEKKKK